MTFKLHFGQSKILTMLLKQIPIFLALIANLYTITTSNRPQTAISDAIQSAFDCTLDAHCLIITEAGVVKITLSITAEDCSLAQRGIWEAVKGFVKGI